jgi:hypothetical protein
MDRRGVQLEPPGRRLRHKSPGATRNFYEASGRFVCKIRPLHGSLASCCSRGASLANNANLK